MTNHPFQFQPRGTKEQIENGTELMPKFDQNGLIPAIAVDHQSNEILMVAYMNAESLAKTLALNEAVYWSRSRNELWHKGATSGQIQTVQEIWIDCDQDCLILKVVQAGDGACHTGHRSCFYRKLINTPSHFQLEDVTK